MPFLFLKMKAFKSFKKCILNGFGNEHFLIHFHPIVPSMFFSAAIRMLTPTTTMKWRLCGGGATMKTSECSTLKPPSLITTL